MSAVTSQPPWQAPLRHALDEIDRERTQTLPARRAEVIARAVSAAGRGGRAEVAKFLGLSVNAVDKALQHTRNRPAVTVQSLPTGTFRRLLAVEVQEIASLTRAQWEALAWVIRGIALDPSWIEQPGALLADEIEDAELDARVAPGTIAAACRSWSRVQALAVIDRCQRADLDALPTAP